MIVCLKLEKITPYLNCGLSSAEVVIDNGEVAAGGMVDLEHSIHNVFPETHITLTWRADREKKREKRGQRREKEKVKWGRDH